MLVWIWLLISALWFGGNAYVIRPYDFNFWFVASLPFFIGLLYFVAARLMMKSWKKPPGFPDY